MVEFLKNLFFTVVGSFVYAIFSDYVDYLRIYRKSDFTGNWKNSVLDSSGNVVKIDYCRLLHNKRNGTIKGTIVREVPESYNYRKWYCNGVLIRDRIIMSFWSANDSQKSDGSGYLFLTEDKKFEGVYIHSTKDNKITTVNVKSEKVQDMEKIKRIKKLLKK